MNKSGIPFIYFVREYMKGVYFYGYFFRKYRILQFKKNL